MSKSQITNHKPQTTKTFLAGLGAAFLMFGIAPTANASLVAHWGFDETGGITAFDSAGGVNGTLVDEAVFTTTGGVSGGAIQITNGYVDMGDNFASTATFSVQSWVKIAAGDTSGMVPVGKHWAGIAQGYFLSINNIGDGYTQANTEGFYSANGSYQTAVGGPPVNDGIWHQLVGTYNNGSTSIYVDGNLAGSGSAGYANNTAHFMIGGLFNFNGTPVNTYQGLIDEVSIYDNALSGNEVRELYNNTLGPESPVPLPNTLLLFVAGTAGLLANAMTRRTNGARAGIPS